MMSEKIFYHDSRCVAPKLVVESDGKVTCRGCDVDIGNGWFFTRRLDVGGTGLSGVKEHFLTGCKRPKRVRTT